SMSVQYDSREQTLQQMARYLEETNRETRKEAWELVERRRLQDRHTLNKIYDKMIELRDNVARNAGFPNFRDYAFLRLERFDYTPEDCFRFHDTVERLVVPLHRQLQTKRQQRLGIETLRPWDLLVDPEGLPPLRPFDEVDELVGGSRRIFRSVDSELAGFFDRIYDLGLLDLDSRKGKAPGGYQATLAERRLPFIFTNAVGRDSDIRTMLHEAGHAFHTSLTRDEPLNDYRHAPMEFAEVASMTMDLIAGESLEAFYGPDEKARSKRDHLEGIVRLLPWIATIDGFQHWVYTNPEHTASEREEFWLQLHGRFGGVESWEGYEEILRNQWQRQLHLFQVPFYYIEYGIAQLGALGLWLEWRRDPGVAVAAYKRGLSLGGSTPLPELFAASGLRFDFGPETLKPVAEELRSELSI
ncbi:MAG: M3 family oligoendopeptidase, partial [Candidatus Geothermarchaeales archaeon]